MPAERRAKHRPESAPVTPSARVAVVGGGLTGLTAAWRLHKAGFQVQVFERSDNVGGRTRSIRKDGFIFDVGAITMLPTYANTCALIDELGIGNHLHRVTPVIGIPRGGRTHRLDLARPLRSLLGTKLISAGAKVRLLKLLPAMARAWRRATYQTMSTLAPWDHETIADYARRELGDEIHEYIAGPIIRGNTLNATECAPAGELLWMLRQYAAPYLFGFDQGINFLAETLGARLPVEFGTEILAVDRQAQGVTIRGRHADGREFSDGFDACVLALPPNALLPLGSALSVRQRAFMASIVPLCSVNLHVGLRRAPAATETFILPPASEHPVLTTIVMDHLKAPGRAPAGKGVVSFFLRDDWCAANFERPDAALLEDILAMARPFVGDLRADVETYVVQRWPYAIIKSEVGLYRRMREYEAALDPSDRVQIGGDFLSLGMEAAVSSGTVAAERLSKVLELASA
jgi:oxygen-dependent protoporphyrinogen oxidase